MTGVLLNAAAQLLLKAGTNRLGVHHADAPTTGPTRCGGWRREGLFHRRRRVLCREPRRLDPRAVARAGVDRLPDAVARLRRQRDRGALPVRRSGHACSAGSASASSSSASVWWRAADRWRWPRRSSSRARCSTRRRSPPSPTCCARARSRAAPWVERFEAALSAFCGGRPVRVLTSATAAIEVALQLCGIGPGDEVITCGAELLHRRST